MGNSIDILGLDFVFHIMKSKIKISCQLTKGIVWYLLEWDTGQKLYICKAPEPVTKADVTKSTEMQCLRYFNRMYIWDSKNYSIQEKKIDRIKIKDL